MVCNKIEGLEKMVKELEKGRLKKGVKMNNMCWCKDCKWFYEEHCANGLSDMCTEMMGDYNSCEYSEKGKMTQNETIDFLWQELKKRNFVEESMRGAVKILKELYMLAENMENYSASYALAEGIVALEDKVESKEKENDNE